MNVIGIENDKVASKQRTRYLNRLRISLQAKSERRLESNGQR